MFSSSLRKISQLCQDSGGPLTPAELGASFERLLAGHEPSRRFMIRDDHLLLDKLREKFLPDAPKVFGNRAWISLYRRQLDVPKAREFFDRTGLKNSFTKVEDWQGEPHPLIQISTEPEGFRTIDNRPLITLRVLCKPDGVFHAALLVATKAKVERDAPANRINSPVKGDAARQVMSLFIKCIDPELGSSNRGSSEITRF